MGYMENKIKYYTEDNEKFADVYIKKDLIFKCRVNGLNNSGSAVILLHGFPETSKMWSKLIQFLSDNNYKVIAPDQRGYSPNARPSSLKEYKIDKLGQDVIDIANAFNFKKFHLVGHDWGSAIGWFLCAIHSKKIITYTPLSVPHLDAFGDAIKNDIIQKKKSFYLKWFRMKFLPEFYFKILNYKNLKSLWRSSDKKEIDSYIKVFSQKNTLTTALNWYRANNFKGKRKIGKIKVPILMIYGTKDMAIGEKAVDETKNYVDAPYRLLKIKASHWLIQDSFDLISNEILNHLKE